jgi:acyl carrier protein
MTAADIDGWDSVNHINLVITVERRFGIRFSMAEIASIATEGKNVGDFEEVIARKVAEKK